MELLIALLIVCGALGLSVGIKCLLNKSGYVYNPADIAYVQSIFQLTMDVVDELNLKEEPQIKAIAKIVSSALLINAGLNQVILEATDGANLTENTYKMVKDVCNALDIELTPSRERIIIGLIDVGLNNLGLTPTKELDKTCLCCQLPCDCGDCEDCK